MSQQRPVDFGYRKVSPGEKTRLVGGVFERVAERYDVMNDIMSLGTHRLFKRMAVEMSGVRPGMRVLDLAGGTGDLSALLAEAVEEPSAGSGREPSAASGREPSAGSGTQGGSVVLADINAAMMRLGRDRLLDRGLAQVALCQASAEALPFADGSFHCVVIGFGLRNFTDKDTALREIARVLAPGGVLLVLEFSKPENALLESAYAMFQSLWPGIGQMVVGDAGSYQYLVESIRVHPSQKALKLMLEDAGLEQVEYHNLAGGIAAIHRGVKP